MCVRSGVQKPIAQEVANFIAKHRAIWSGHRADRHLMALSLKNGNWDGDFNEEDGQLGDQRLGVDPRNCRQRGEGCCIIIFYPRATP